MSLTIQTFNENSLVLIWPGGINQDTCNHIHSLNKLIKESLFEVVIETVPSYCSLAVYHDPLISQSGLITKIHKLDQFCKPHKPKHSKTWEIPVCYDPSLGIDLEKLAQDKSLRINQIISLHTKPLYRVEFLGFLPGFPYLTGLDPVLDMPRLEKPREKIEKGSVAIGGSQTGVYPVASPAGWHVIGRTSLSLFNPKNNKPCLIEPMDKIKFRAVSLAEFNRD